MARDNRSYRFYILQGINKIATVFFFKLIQVNVFVYHQPCQTDASPCELLFFVCLELICTFTKKISFTFKFVNIDQCYSFHFIKGINECRFSG